MKSVFNALAIGAALLAAVPANAAKQFTFTFDAPLTNGDAISGHGVITTDDGTMMSPNFTVYDVTDVTGAGKFDWMKGENAIDGLLFGGGKLYGVNGGYTIGNLALSFDGMPYFFILSTFEGPTTGEGVDGISSNNVRVSIEPATSAVPEAATWAQMIAGFGAVGGILRRRRARRIAVA